MNEDELRFAEFVREHKTTIYTVCYMFSQNEDEVADLFQEVLIKLWSGSGHSRAGARNRLGFAT